MTKPRWIALLLLLAVPLPAAWAQFDEFDQEVPEAPVAVDDARIRWLPGESPLAGYMTLRNISNEPLLLNGASSPAFDLVGLHRSTRSDTGVRMEALQAVELPPGQTVAFEPGGRHLMLGQRREPVNVGDTVPVMLKFSNGSIRNVEFEVHAPTLQ